MVAASRSSVPYPVDKLKERLRHITCTVATGENFFILFLPTFSKQKSFIYALIIFAREVYYKMHF